MQNIWSYISDSGDFIDKINRIKNVLKDAPLITADVIRFSHCILHVTGLKTLRNPLDGREINLFSQKNFCIRQIFSCKTVLLTLMFQ